MNANPCPVSTDLNTFLTNQDAFERKWDQAMDQTKDTDYESQARDWLLSTREEDFYPDYPRKAKGIDILMEAVACTDEVAQVAMGKVLSGIAKPEDAELCRHKLGLLVEEYAEKFQERDVRGLL